MAATEGEGSPETDPPRIRDRFEEPPPFECEWNREMNGKRLRGDSAPSAGLEGSDDPGLDGLGLDGLGIPKTGERVRITGDAGSGMFTAWGDELKRRSGELLIEIAAS